MPIPHVHGHQRADRRNLHLHRAALNKLRERPELRKACLELVTRWLDDRGLETSRPWLEQWREMLDIWPWQRMADAVLDETAGQTLRQCSPLAPTLTPRERWKLFAEIERELDDEFEQRDTSP